MNTNNKNNNKQPQHWFTSDTHFGHENVIRYSNRPYTSKEEMDEALIRNWNSKVQQYDSVTHIGDIFFCKKDRGISILSRLNGQITLVMGNHDKQIRRDADYISKFFKVVDYLELTIEGQKIVCSHYPMMTWNGSSRGSWMLHGHSHHSLKYPFKQKILDVGVDGPGYGYAPLSFDEISRKLKNIESEFPDHHGA